MSKSAKESGRYLAEWRTDYNESRPHSAFGNIQPAVFARENEACQDRSVTPPHQPKDSTLPRRRKGSQVSPGFSSRGGETQGPTTTDQRRLPPAQAGRWDVSLETFRTSGEFKV
jgi:hypothetical protein